MVLAQHTGVHPADDDSWASTFTSSPEQVGRLHLLWHRSHMHGNSIAPCTRMRQTTRIAILSTKRAQLALFDDCAAVQEHLVGHFKSADAAAAARDIATHLLSSGAQHMLFPAVPLSSWQSALYMGVGSVCMR